jgi:hypothetical protein
MQGDVSRATVATFIPTFFHELTRAGRIDQAMAAARRAVRDHPDWWAPTLFMRLKTGRLWYGSRFGQPFARWPALLNSIANRRCTPILGPGVIDSLVGPRREIARRWASAFHFPRGSSGGDDPLPRVAQYLADNVGTSSPYDEFQKYLGAELLTRYRRGLPDSLYDHGRNTPEEIRGQALDELFAAVAAVRRREPELLELHSMLAELPLPLFVTTQPIDLMEEALRALGKQPEREVFRWRGDDEDVAWPVSVFDREPEYQPDERRPLVIHMFGHVRYPGSMLLTEDDYFDFLIETGETRYLVPPFVRKRLSATVPLFLGFEFGLDDWDVRCVVRNLIRQEGRSHRAKLINVVIPTEPHPSGYLTEDLEPQGTILYLKGVESFIRELYEIWKEAYEETAL